mgnify:CR=1 FL=1
MDTGRVILNQDRFQLTLERLCHQLIEEFDDFKDTCLIGIQPRGVFLSQRIHARLIELLDLPSLEYGKLDITFYRDDFRMRTKPLKANTTEMPFLVEDYLRLPEAFVGYFLATMLAGGIASYVAIGAARQGGRVDRFTFVLSFLVLAVAIFVAGRWTVPPVLFPALFVAGGCIGASNLIVTSTVQRVVEPERHGRVFALLEALSSVSAPISYAVSGVLIDFVMADLSGVFLAVSAAILVLFVAVALNGELGRYIERKNVAYHTHERS